MVAGVSSCVGVLSVAGADIRSRGSASGAYGLFWLGLALIFLPAAWQLCRRSTPRTERLVLVVVVGLSLYLVKCLYSPSAFVFHDEFAHLRTVINLRNTGQLFGFNPEIRVAGDYPGLALVTLTLAKVSGLSLVSSGMVIIGVGRLVLMLALFLLLERLTGSARAAGIGCLIYAGNANFLYWSAQFAYESLALPLALAVAFLVLRRSDGSRARPDPSPACGSHGGHHPPPHGLCPVRSARGLVGGGLHPATPWASRRLRPVRPGALRRGGCGPVARARRSSDLELPPARDRESPCPGHRPGPSPRNQSSAVRQRRWPCAAAVGKGRRLRLRRAHLGLHTLWAHAAVAPWRSPPAACWRGHQPSTC